MRVVLALLLISNVHAADWIRVRSADIEFLTDAPEKTARQTMQRLAQIRSLLPTQEIAAVPLRIYLFASQREYQSYAPVPTSGGFYQSGFDHDSIAMYVGAGLDRAAVHEFVHFALNTRGTVRPGWQEEGLAEYYSNAEFRRDGVRLGAPIREHVELLKNVRRMTAEELAVPRQDPMFYAQSWALVREIRGEATVPVPPVRDLQFDVERVSALDSLLLRGELALRTGHLVPARELYVRAERQYPGSAKAVAGLAALAEAEGDRERAKELFQRSLEMDVRNAAAWFQYAIATGDEGALRKAAELDPDLGEAQLLLGNRAADEGDFEGAMEHLGRATVLMPRKSYAWYSLAFARYRFGAWDGARESVDLALQTAASPEQTAMAQALKEALGRDSN